MMNNQFNFSTNLWTSNSTNLPITIFLTPIDRNEILNSNLTYLCDIEHKIDISEHYLYLVLNVFIVCGFSLPTSKSYLVYLHLLLSFAYFLQSFWSWHKICGSNLFTWSVAFFILNSFSTIKFLVQKKEVTFSVDLLNDAYSAIFKPMTMSKNQIKKLFSPEFAKIICLEKGEAYAIENKTKTDKLALLLTGRATVTSGENHLLHVIEEMQFLDSPEFQSKTADEKFHVSIFAETDCQVLCWQKSALQYFLNKESLLAQIFTTVLANDIANKLFAMNERVQFDKGNYLDIRKTLFLPSLSTTYLDKFVNDKSDNESNHSIQNQINK